MLVHRDYYIRNQLMSNLKHQTHRKDRAYPEFEYSSIRYTGYGTESGTIYQIFTWATSNADFTILQIL